MDKQGRSIAAAAASTCLFLVAPAFVPPAGAQESGAAGGGAEIRATGSFTTAFVVPPIAERTPDLDGDGVADLVVVSRYAVNTYSGSLEGRSLTLMTRTTDDKVEKKAFDVNPGTFWGTLNGSEPGSFSFIVHLVIDRSDCPCPPGTQSIEGRFVVVEGTGIGGLEGICGGGTFKGEVVPGMPMPIAYDYAFRFGEACRAGLRPASNDTRF